MDIDIAEADREPVTVVHGRFQPLHIGHMEYLHAGLARGEVLVVGITNPDPSQIAHEATDPNRDAPAANPCTFYERFLMIEQALRNDGVSPAAFRIVPFPHSYPQRLRYYAPEDALYLLSIYDAWGEAKLTRFTQLGLRTEVLWRRTAKVTTGTAIRESIRRGGDWRQLVPPAVADIITTCGIDRRMAVAGAALAADAPRAFAGPLQ